MGGSSEPRSNDAWVAALRTGGDAGAIRDLEAYLRRILRSVARGRLGAEAVDELVQESVVRIVNNLPSFRGDSAFQTWAAGVATRVLFTELRRRHVREKRRIGFDEALADAAELARPRSPSPQDAAHRGELREALEHAITTALTERQRTAILAELRGVPTVEIAARLETNQNALYKLTHDARKKLRRALLERGFTAESLRPASETLR